MSTGPSNTERLMQLYDPTYVRHVEARDGLPVQVCLESRMQRDGAGTGVATYARVLAGCLSAAGATPFLLDDGYDADAPPRPRMRRWLSAARPSARTAVAGPYAAGEAPGQWTVPDIFREAQVFFNLHGRLLPIALARPPSVMHWSYPVPLHVIGARNLYTIHDLIPLTDPALTTIAPARHAAMLRKIVERAHGLVTVSETVRALVIDHLRVPADKVTNTYQAVDAPLQSDPPLPAGLRPGRYFLFCGRVEPRKNLERLAQAHAASGAAMPLVIVGPQVAGAERLEAMLASCPGVVRLPFLPRNALLGLIRSARALFLPSLAEGFGLPIAEAMTLGCPVLTADRGATAEIAADAALLVAPTETAQIAGAIGRLAQDDGLCARLRKAGFARGRMFTQHLYARRLRALYVKALDVAAAGGRGE